MPAYGRKTSFKLFCKAGGQGYRAKLPGKSAGQGCMARVHAMVQYAESMVKLDNNAVF
jgi:hypothetical protein